MFAHHFAGQELGSKVQADAFQRAALARQAAMARSRGSTVVRPSEAVTRTELGIAMHKGKLGRAVCLCGGGRSGGNGCQSARWGMVSWSVPSCQMS